MSDKGSEFERDDFVLPSPYLFLPIVYISTTEQTAARDDVDEARTDSHRPPFCSPSGIPAFLIFLHYRISMYCAIIIVTLALCF